MGMISWIVIGIVAGVVSKLVRPRQYPESFFTIILIGVTGALIGGFPLTMVGFGGGVEKIHVINSVASLIGALIVLWGYKFLMRT